ncbi:hypothetical protein CLOM_g2102 [Closterium sp. NIES-68]|nr:hypothetical protein CLOM_g2102 [Closterium sp. NIES-68]GJP71785.1 hypothetical protein CLOP_g2577 [Closterium sp. NIES-67]
MDFFAGKAAEKQINGVGETINTMVNDASEAVTNWWEGLMGKVQKPLAGILEQYEIPVGIFPKNHVKYVLKPSDSSKPEAGGVLEVYFTGGMEIKLSDGTVLKYAKKVVTRISAKEMAGIVGMKLKGITGYSEISAVSVDTAKDNIHLQTRVRKTKPLHLFKSARQGVEVLDVS